MAEVLDRADGFAIVGVADFYVPVYVGNLDVSTAVAEFTAQVVPHIAVMVHVQAEIVFDAAGDGAGFNLCLRIGGNGEFDASVDRLEIDVGLGQAIETGFEAAVDGGKVGASGEILRAQFAIDAGGADFAAHAIDVEAAVHQLDFVEARCAGNGERVFDASRIVA